jgi:signal transduction histidine kinase
MRLRIAVPVAAFAVLVIVAQAIAMLLMIEEREEEFIDALINQQVAHAMEARRHIPPLAFPDTAQRRLYRIAHDAANPAVPPALAALTVGNHELYEAGREFHVAVRVDDQARYILVYDAEEHEQQLRAIQAITLTAALLLGVATLAGAYALSGRLAAQLEALAARLSAAGTGSYVEPDMPRELLAIAHALDAQEARQRSLLARERDITANLSHELRTPLTRLRTDAELLAGLPELPATAVRRAQRIIAAADQITALSGTLLMLAREATPAASECVPLGAALTACWQGLTEDAGHLDLAPELATAQLDCDPALLDVVLRNLFDNALRHGGGHVRCALDGTQLQVCDHGPGFAAADLPRVFERFYRGGATGHGLGLALVKHISTACGWVVTAANAPQGGACMHIDFGAALRHS